MNYQNVNIHEEKDCLQVGSPKWIKDLENVNYCETQNKVWEEGGGGGGGLKVTIFQSFESTFSTCKYHGNCLSILL
jgi:hypothetical protein